MPTIEQGELNDTLPSSTRRAFLRLGFGGAAALTLVTACGGAPLGSFERPVPQAAPASPQAKEVTQSPNAYLTLPFRRSDLDSNKPYELSEGMFYSDEEKAIHHMEKHNGIDFELPYKTPLVVPRENALAVASYQTLWARDEKGEIIKYNGEGVRIGFGYFIELRDETSNRIIQLAHLSLIAINPKIPFHEPTYDPVKDQWNPTVFNLPTQELKTKGLAIAVRRGQDLGTVGYSGLMHGTQIDYAIGAKAVTLSQDQNKSWDDPHAHLEIADRIAGSKSNWVDPYDINKTFEHYPSPTRQRMMGPNHIWFLGADGLPAFAA